ncbi:MAG: shikimate kinase [Spirochaetales bacterium]|nr:shikimate kinase [Spirochaetales bacterium]
MEGITRILITGMKHSGKSTAGRSAAETLGADFLDMDDLIEDLFLKDTGERLNPREIYQRGRDIFQNLEYKAADLLSRRNGSFFAASGGGICDNEAACVRLENFIWVYIEEDPVILFERIKNGGIPAFLTSEDPYGEFLNLYKHRSALYKKLCNIRITAGGRRPPEICSEIIKKLKEGGYGGK